MNAITTQPKPTDAHHGTVAARVRVTLRNRTRPTIATARARRPTVYELRSEADWRVHVVGPPGDGVGALWGQAEPEARAYADDRVSSNWSQDARQAWARS